MKQRGMTLVEILVLIVIGGIIVTMGINFLYTSNNTQFSYGIYGPMETRCVDGYKILVGRSGHPIQMVDHHGNGIPCTTIESVK